jgi:hypothetical protein
MIAPHIIADDGLAEGFELSSGRAVERGAKKRLIGKRRRGQPVQRMGGKNLHTIADRAISADPHMMQGATWGKIAESADFAVIDRAIAENPDRRLGDDQPGQAAGAIDLKRRHQVVHAVSSLALHLS